MSSLSHSHDHSADQNPPPASQEEGVAQVGSTPAPLTPVGSTPAPLTPAGSTPAPNTPGSTPAPLTPISTPLPVDVGRQFLPRADIAATPNQYISGQNALDPAGASQPSDPIGPTSTIWGTTVSVEEVNKNLLSFFKCFALDAPNHRAEPSATSYYMQLIRHVYIRSERVVEIDCKDIFDFDEELYNQLIMYPQEMIPLCDMTVNKLLKEIQGISLVTSGDGVAMLMTRFYNMKTLTSLRELDPKDVDMMVCMRGMVIRCSQLLPELRRAFFRCTVCQHTVEVDVDRGRIEEPHVCSSCKTKLSYLIEHNRGFYTDKQLIRLQEAPESVPPGETPYTVTLYCHDDLVDSVKPGDRVQVTGVFRAAASRQRAHQRTLHSVFRTYVDVVHFMKMDSFSRALTGDAEPFSVGDGEEDAPLVLSKDQQERLERIVQCPDIYGKLIRSFAPSIFELDYVKKGVLCQLFGGVQRDLSAAGGGRFRGDINILLCGDPATSKSQILSYVHKIAPRGIFTSGRGSSAVGLTAYVLRDAETKELVLESGALVLSDKGICCIDEFDKMGDSARTTLHEAMEQQTISVAKAGIICNLNARTAILAAANPVESHFDTSKTVVENVNLPPTLLSRFDLIFLLLDKVDETHDRRLAMHIVGLYQDVAKPSAPQKSPQKPKGRRRSKTASSPAASEPVEEDELLSAEDFKLFIRYARALKPKISDAAGLALVEKYKEMRLRGSRHTIAATPRQLESLIRLSEALARMQLQSEVTEAHVLEASNLIEEALRAAATDPTTGKIDISKLTTGRSESERQRLARLKPIIEDVGRNHMEMGKTYDVLYVKELVEQGLQGDVDFPRGVPFDLIKAAIAEIHKEKEGFLMLEKEPGKVRRVKGGDWGAGVQ